MNTDQLIDLALKAGFPQWWITPPEPERQDGESLRMLKRFAELVAVESFRAGILHVGVNNEQ